MPALTGSDMRLYVTTAAYELQQSNIRFNKYNRNPLKLRGAPPKKF